MSGESRILCPPPKSFDTSLSAPYVVGVNPNSPSNPHSASASGGNDASNIDSSPPTMLRTLFGAVIGGPDKTDRYFDIRSDWPQTEVPDSHHYLADPRVLNAFKLGCT